MSQDDFFAAVSGDSPASSTDSRGRRRRQRAERQRRRRRRRVVTTVVVVLALALVGFVGYQALGVVKGASASATSVQDYEGAGEGEVVVTIPDGATGADIAALLKDAGVVATTKAFTDAYAANSNASKIQAGTYTLRLRMSGANAVAMLLDPAARSDHSLTIAEGYTKDQVRDQMVAMGAFTKEEVDAAFADAAAIGLPEEAGGNVEGWLAPSTYDIPEDASATDVVASMVAKTMARLTAAKVPQEDYEAVLTEASIVEREARADYFGQVARVIDNRLADTNGETKGYLQMDSTVLYGLGRTSGIPTSAEVGDASNPYNTYAHAGLPPSPIGSPGEAAIAAVLNPPAGDWLYFVTVDLDTGETLFATTHEEQVANTKKLTEYCSAHADKCSGQG